MSEEKKELKFKKLVDEIKGLSVMELSELVKKLEGELGVSAAMPMAAAAPAAGAVGAGEAEAEEKSAYNVIIATAGDQKIAVIKAVRVIRPDLGLKEAKDLVDGAPKEVKANVKKEEAEEAKKKLEAAGATVELK
ncbi:MAG: 50S ribosomal protein L7/L12 [bacterium]|nr:50S ribosomal protein L7/L12 [bacterium]